MLATVAATSALESPLFKMLATVASKCQAKLGPTTCHLFVWAGFRWKTSLQGTASLRCLVAADPPFPPLNSLIQPVARLNVIHYGMVAVWDKKRASRPSMFPLLSFGDPKTSLPVLNFAT